MPAQAIRAENRSVDLVSVSEFSVPTDDFQSPKAWEDGGCEDEYVDIGGLGKEPTIGVTSVGLSEVGSHSAIDCLEDSKNNRGQAKTKKAPNPRTFAIKPLTMTEEDAEMLVEQKLISEYRLLDGT